MLWGVALWSSIKYLPLDNSNRPLDRVGCELTSLRTYIQHRESVLVDVKQILIDALFLRVEPQDLDPDTALFGIGLGLDSVDALEIIVAVESHFDLSLSEEEAVIGDEGTGDDGSLRGTQMQRYLRTINSLVDMILHLQKEKSA